MPRGGWGRSSAGTGSSASSTGSAKSTGRSRGSAGEIGTGRSIRSGDLEEKAGSKRRSSSRDGAERGRDAASDDKKNTDKKGGRGNPKAKAGAGVSIEGTIFASLPRVADVAVAEQKELFRRKMRECETVFDFRTDGQHPEKEGKRQTLTELVEHMSSSKKLFDEPLMRDAVDMIAANLFRTLAKRERTPLDLMDPDDEPALDPAWPHLEVTYEFLLKFLTSKDVNADAAASCIDQKFTSRLIELFDSDDPRERESLKNILSKIYYKFTNLRKHIRGVIQNTCLRAIYEDDILNGIGELLEILNRSIIGSFPIPLKDDNRKLLLRVLMPLHKVCSLNLFHPQLLDCAKTFTAKEPKTAFDVVKGLLFFWPCCSHHKQMLFLDELEEMLLVIPPAELQKLQEPLARRLAACISSPNSDVAERSLIMCKTSSVVKFITKICKEQYPVMVSALYGNASAHWHPGVHPRTIDMLRQLMEADHDMFDTSSTRHRKQAELEEKAEQERLRKWSLLQEMHEKRVVLQRATPAATPHPARRRAPRGPAQQPTGSPAKPTGDAADSPFARQDTVTGNTAASCASQPSQPRSSGSHRLAECGSSDEGVQRPPAQPVGRRASPSPPAEGLEEKGAADLNTSERYGVALSWDRGAAAAPGPMELGLQALTVDKRGKIVGAVHDYNYFAHGSALEYCPSGEVTDKGTGCDGITWINLDRLPRQVVLLLFVMAVHQTGRSADATNRTIHLFEGSASKRVGRYPVSHKTPEACAVAAIKRVGSGRWKMLVIQEAAKAGRHYLEVVEPVLGKVVHDLLPSLARRQKVFVSMAMEKGSVADLPLPQAARWLFVGVSWDLGRAGHAASLAVSAVLLGAKGRELGVVTTEAPCSEGVRHCGGNAGVLSSGFNLEQAAVPDGVEQIFVVCNVRRDGHPSNGDPIQRPDCCVVDPHGCELARFTAAEVLRSGGLLLARLFRVSGRGRWGFQALGDACAGATLRDCLGEVGAMCARRPQDLQQCAPDAAYASTNSSDVKRSIVSL